MPHLRTAGRDGEQRGGCGIGPAVGCLAPLEIWIHEQRRPLCRLQRDPTVGQRVESAPRSGRAVFPPGEPQHGVRRDLEPASQSQRTVGQQHQDGAGGVRGHASRGGCRWLPAEPAHGLRGQQRSTRRCRRERREVGVLLGLCPQPETVSRGRCGQRAERPWRQPGAARCCAPVRSDQLAAQLYAAGAGGNGESQPPRRALRGIDCGMADHVPSVPLSEQPGDAGGELAAG